MAATVSLTRQFTDLVTTTQMLIHKEEPIPRQIFDAHVLLDWLQGSGHLKMVSGGERIEIPIENGVNDNRGFFAENEAMPTMSQQIVTSAFYQWKYAGITVRYSGPELRRNSGKSQLYDLTKLRMNNAKASLADLINRRLITNDGSTNNPNSLELVIATDPTVAAATLGEINPAVDTTWRNYIDTSGHANATELLGAMEYAIPQCSRGHSKGEPTIFLTTPGVYNQFGAGVHGIERVITEFKRGEVGNRSYKRWSFKGIPLEYDFAIPSGTMYILPMSYLYLYMDSAANMTPQELIRPHNQDALVGQILSQLQLVASCRRHFGKITSITEATP